MFYGDYEYAKESTRVLENRKGNSLYRKKYFEAVGGFSNYVVSSFAFFGIYSALEYQANRIGKYSFYLRFPISAGFSYLIARLFFRKNIHSFGDYDQYLLLSNENEVNASIAKTNLFDMHERNNIILAELHEASIADQSNEEKENETKIEEPTQEETTEDEE